MAIDRDNEVSSGPRGCTAAVIIKGEHHWCDQQVPHTGWPHANSEAEAVWRGTGPDEDDAAHRHQAAEGVTRYSSLDEMRADAERTD